MRDILRDNAFMGSRKVATRISARESALFLQYGLCQKVTLYWEFPKKVTLFWDSISKTTLYWDFP